MMPTTSVVPAVKARCVDLLSNAPALSGVAVSWARKGDGSREEIYFAKTSINLSGHAMAAGRQRRDEVSDLIVVIFTGTPGVPASEAEKRAFELYAAIEDLVANDPALNIGLSQNAGGIDGVLSAVITNATTGP